MFAFKPDRRLIGWDMALLRLLRCWTAPVVI